MRLDKILTLEQFNKVVDKGVCAVLFSAPWCGPCREIDRALVDATSPSECKIYSVNTDDNEKICTSQGIRSVPTLIFYIDGVEHHKKVGLIHPTGIFKLYDETLKYYENMSGPAEEPEKTVAIKRSEQMRPKGKENEKAKETKPKNMLAVAYRIAAVAFEDKEDKGGAPYMEHCVAVMNGVAHLGLKYKTAALLHDVPEDTKITFKDLYAEGFCSDVINALDCLTHRPGEAYDDYIIRVGSNDISREVKKSDLTHNSQINRMKGLRDKDFHRLEKYHRAYKYLEDTV